MLKRLPKGIRISPVTPHNDNDLGMQYKSVTLELPNGKLVSVHWHKPEMVRAKCGNLVTGELDSGGLYKFLADMMSE